MDTLLLPQAPSVPTPPTLAWNSLLLAIDEPSGNTHIRIAGLDFLAPAQGIAQIRDAADADPLATLTRQDDLYYLEEKSTDGQRIEHAWTDGSHALVYDRYTWPGEVWIWRQAAADQFTLHYFAPGAHYLVQRSGSLLQASVWEDGVAVAEYTLTHAPLVTAGVAHGVMAW